ncbi:MAG: sorbosone dehydrogenase, partial [Planctomycetota bacterium]|nr:sorbosone dehydrogenase [Planctomycetota bacterium]
MRFVPRFLLFWLVAFCLCVSPALAQRELKDIPDPDPEIERKSFQVAEGFEVSLYAADPLFAKPIQMNFDPQGRLWIASSEIYPHIEPGKPATDKILVVEDVDGDGVADSTTVFADGLLIPTGIEPGDGGAYVANSTELVHLADTDGDGKADVKRVILSGFGTEDTHHIIHTFRWGVEGLLHFNQSIYIHSHIETPWGVRRLGGGGIWQLRPESSRLEVFAKGLVNPWGFQQDDWGQSFATDGAGGEGINFMFPGSVYLTSPGATRIMKGLNPGSPKYCGLEIVGGTHFPEAWRGNMITNDFRGHRVCRFVISEDGSGYAAREQSEVIKTSHVAFRPIDVKMGPDGALYIADWYNPIIQHGEVDFRDPRRDHTHGRIWRVTAKDRPLVPRKKLADRSTFELLTTLASPESFDRHHAKRVLKERGAEQVLPELGRWVAVIDGVSADSDHQRLEALWLYQSFDEPNAGLLDQVLRSTDHRARGAAVRVLSAWSDRVDRPLDRLAIAVTDDHPRVRLEAVRVLAALPSLASADIALRALDRPLDANLDFALWQTARDLQPFWLPAVEKGERVFDGDIRRLTFALNSVGAPAVVGPLVDLLKQGKVSAGDEEQVLTLVAALGGAPELRLVLDLALADAESVDKSALATKLLSALAEAAGRRHVIPAGDLAPIGKLLGKRPDLDAAICRAAGVWKVEALRQPLARIAQGNHPAAPEAIAAIAELGGSASIALLQKLGAGDHAFATRLLAARGLVALEPAVGSKLAIAVLTAASPTDDPTPLFTTLWQSKQGPELFAVALGETKLPADVAKIGIRTARIAGRDLGSAVAALTKAGGLNAPLTEIPAAEMQKLVTLVREQGDPARGEATFRRAETLCLRCHAISGAGGQVGPDLTSIGASAQIDYLIESILLPNKAVKENYHSLVVETQAGKILNGVKIRENANELILRNADDVELSIPVSEIAERVNGGSIMPAGLTDTLTQSELVDLVRFLSELGKLGPYAPSQARVARRWQGLDPATPGLRDLLIAAPATVVSRQDLVWSPVYTRVAGELPLPDLPVVIYPIGGVKANFARTQVEVTTGGKVALKL